MSKKRLYHLLAILMVIVITISACAPAATQAPAAETPDATQAPAATEVPAATEAPDAEPVEITYLVDDAENTVNIANALAEAFMAKYPNITVIVETRPQGGDGDNVVKTRLATGEMTDVFSYNSGSLLQALHPADTLVDLTNEAFMSNVVESFFPTVSQDGKVYGIPFGTAMGGGILYNKKVYADLGLSVPTTWAEFEANNEAIKASGIAPIIATYGDTWTSQLFVLADYYNVEQANSTFATDYTNNKAKYATTPGAMNGFDYLREGFDKNWYQEDFATAKFDQGLQLLAEGKGAHYPMLTFALSGIAANYPDLVNDIGYFGLPGTDAAKSGTTIWMPGGSYIPKTSQHIEEGKLFLAFTASTEGADVMTSASAPAGPYMIKGASLPDDVLPAVKDLAAYIDAEKSGPALEFVSPIKGPSLEQICVAVGSGQMTPEEAAAAYDEDVKKQAQQLGLPGWDN